MPTLRSCSVLNAPTSPRRFVTRKRPSSDRSVSSASLSIAACESAPFASSPSAFPASDSKSWWRAETPMLWKRSSLPIGFAPLIGWQLTQRALP